jgi:hypothetical protein
MQHDKKRFKRIKIALRERTHRGRINPMALIGAPSEADARRLTLPVRSSALTRVRASGG